VKDSFGEELQSSKLRHNLVIEKLPVVWAFSQAIEDKLSSAQPQ
jgi:hypothetical protein